MFCTQCGTKCPDDAVFCHACGHKLVKPEAGPAVTTAPVVETPAEEAPVAEVPAVEEPEVAVEPAPEPAPQPTPQPAPAPVYTAPRPAAPAPANKKSKKGLFIGIAAVVLFFIIVGALSNGVSKSSSSSSGGGSMSPAQIEKRIGEICYDVNANAEDIIALYDSYSNLSDSKKAKVENRDVLADAYGEAYVLVAQRKSLAKEVDNAIDAVKTANMFDKAASTKYAVKRYNALDEYAKKYVSKYDTLVSYYNDVKDMNIAVDSKNLLSLFSISFSAGEKGNYGEGYNETFNNSYTYDEETNTITENYDSTIQNDYAIPVYVYVKSKYPNLTSNCTFDINLHQTYTGLGFVDSDLHEYKNQSGTLSYKSSMGTGEYIIYVEDKDATNSLLYMFGISVDWTDMIHNMNEFDVSRVEISGVSGSVTYQ
ncbi:MAG: zinc ribbon domain-containing protein [Lachnospiraceae bacterium]|nr:zinc ribbon domain-containing protein [Lachnospiraceae bacterium]